MNIMQDSERMILGVDPGTANMGYGLIGIYGTQTQLVTYGVIQLHQYKDHMVKLRKAFERSLNLIEQYLPDELAIEAPFYGKNVQSMLKLGRAQGVAMAAGLYRDIPIFEYAPKRIKQSITGKGGASKEQVAGMLGNLLNTSLNPAYLDATDGLATAMCHYYQGNPAQEKSKTRYSSWNAFIDNNPDRIQ
jgi:crossover junction endodeoxyribonuclease RuvC